jgi:signal transduction histidine kinase
MIGNSIDLCIAPKGKERFWRELAPLAYEHGSIEFEVWLCHRDGSIYRGHSSVAVLRDGQGKIIGAVSCNLDVTAKYRTEQDLIKAKLQAETANRSKSEFLANMSHERRTPLNAILGFSQIMMAGMLVKEDLERVHEYATDIFDSGTHLLAVINDLLDLAKIRGRPYGFGRRGSRCRRDHRRQPASGQRPGQGCQLNFDRRGAARPAAIMGRRAKVEAG